MCRGADPSPWPGAAPPRSPPPPETARPDRRYHAHCPHQRRELPCLLRCGDRAGPRTASAAQESQPSRRLHAACARDRTPSKRAPASSCKRVTTIRSSSSTHAPKASKSAVSCSTAMLGMPRQRPPAPPTPPRWLSAGDGANRAPPPPALRSPRHLPHSLRRLLAALCFPPALAGCAAINALDGGIAVAIDGAGPDNALIQTVRTACTTDGRLLG